MTRDKLFSVGLNDCTVQHFRAGGKGGQHQNKTDSGTRVIHEPSGARGESREHREQRQNTKAAFLKMVQSPLFTYWVAQESKRLRKEQTDLEWVAEQMASENILMEVY